MEPGIRGKKAPPAHNIRLLGPIQHALYLWHDSQTLSTRPVFFISSWKRMLASAGASGHRSVHWTSEEPWILDPGPGRSPGSTGEGVAWILELERSAGSTGRSHKGHYIPRLHHCSQA